MDTLLRDLLAIFAVSVAVLWVSHKLRLPSVVGFLLTGVVAGPHGIGLVRASQQVETLAEIGVVLLLFTIGLELSFERVARAGRALLVGGPLQVVLTTVAVAAVAVAWRVPLPLAILAGLLVSLSSTAIVLRVLQDRAELDTPHGRTIMGALIFQDLAFLPMMLALPFLAGGEGAGAAHLLRIAGGVLALVLVLFAGRWVVPRLLFQVATIRSREAFLLAILVLGLGIAWLGSQAGLSLSLGAFLAGLLLSESEYAHEALASTASLRDLFTSFFFVSVGMLLDLAFVATHLPVVAAVTLGVLLLKIGPAALAAAAAGLPLRSAVLSALALAQVGEFSFVLAGAGLDAGLLEGHAFQLFIAISVLTMVLTPFVISAGSLPLMLPGRRWREERGDGAVVRALPRDQLLIVGFGLNGRNLAHAARHAGIPYTVL
ncbi:MAG: cation:proton antiporter, partial [Acidobacteria bacterium]|nr:cation:proton antiporter [Acidobacteriota bacterium]